MNVDLASPRGTVRYKDSADHFENGLLRLLGMDPSVFAEWMAAAEASPAVDLLARLRDGFAQVRPAPATGAAQIVEPGPNKVRGSVWLPAIAESPAFGIARSQDGSLGWLGRSADGRFIREVTPPLYEEAYFEGDRAQAGGYGEYSKQAGWRLEKAARQVRGVGDLTGLRAGRALDVGSGYGYFRKALGDAGFSHEGIEVSAHARAVASQLFGMTTLPGTLDDYTFNAEYDLVTLWDVIEHVADPGALLSQVFGALKPSGIAALKTPNLDCPEAEVFGPHYHSLKREHLVYFTPRALKELAEQVGLEVVRVGTVSHLLVGFVGPEVTRRWEEGGRGADLVAYFRRPGST